MFSLLRAAFTLLICVLVVGFFLGWFSFSRTPVDPQSNKVNINVSVDRTKMGTDLQRLEQKVSKGIQDLNSQQPAPGSSNGQANGQANGQPRLTLGPITFEPTGPSNNQPAGPPSGTPSLTLGPIMVEPSGSTTEGQPQLRMQTPDYQFTAPRIAPPPGAGR